MLLFVASAALVTAAMAAVLNITVSLVDAVIDLPGPATALTTQLMCSHSCCDHMAAVTTQLL